MNENYTPIERKVQGDYDALASAFSESRKEMHWPELDAMIESVEPGQKVLDIACGTGRVCSFFENKGVEYHGIDISAGEISFAKSRCPQGDFKVGSMLDLPYEDATFDAVFHIAALHHLWTKPERLKALDEAFRVLKSGGTLNLTVMGLWQKKYWKLFFHKAAGKQTLPNELKKSVKFKDVFLPWSWKTEEKRQRYYHAFSKPELKRLFKHIAVEQISYKFIANNKEVPFWKAKNLVVIATKK